MVAMLTLAFASIVALQSAGAPPATKTATTTDSYKEVQVADDYRWLESLEKDSPEVK